MIVGIGVDLVKVSEIRRLGAELGECVFRKMFSEDELEDAKQAACRWEYLASRFAIKEAVYKAVSAFVPDSVDFRFIESKTDRHQMPRVKQNPVLHRVMEAGKVRSILVSVSREEDHVTALAIAQA